MVLAYIIWRIRIEARMDREIKEERAKRESQRALEKPVSLTDIIEAMRGTNHVQHEEREHGRHPG